MLQWAPDRFSENHRIDSTGRKCLQRKGWIIDRNHLVSGPLQNHVPGDLRWRYFAYTKDSPSHRMFSFRKKFSYALGSQRTAAKPIADLNEQFAEPRHQQMRRGLNIREP